MLWKSLCVAFLMAVGDGAEATKQCPCKGATAGAEGQSSKASACDAACSKTAAAVEEACDGCEEAIAAVDKACTACAKIFDVWEKVAADDEPCCGECSKCTKCDPAVSSVVAVDEPCCKKCSKCSKGCPNAAKVAVNCEASSPKDDQITPASAVLAIEGAPDAQALLRQKLVERDALQREIDELSAATESWQQIVVRVKVMEVNLTKMRKQGVDFATSLAPFARDETLADGSRWNTAYSKTAAPVGHGQAPCGAGTCQNHSAATSFWDMLEQNNIARVMAEPTLAVVSGRAASFEVGGELPIPAGQGSAGACQFISFGTKLDVLASALGGNKVRLEVRPKISEVCDDRAMVADDNGNRIPSLRVTQCDTACELEFGETAALTGLVTRRVEACKTDKGLKEEPQDVMLLVVVTPDAVGTRVVQRVAEAK
jgi:hypothetical protein